MLRRLMACFLLAGIIGACGCAKVASRAYFLRAPEAAVSVAAPSDKALYDEPTASPPPAQQTPQEYATAKLASAVDSSQQAAERIIIYTARLQVSTVDVEAALASAQKLCTEVGGYMDAMTAGSITMRVPAQKFFAVLDEVRKLGQVLARDINAQDVTDEYVDLRLRLKNAEATRDRLLAILEKAQTVKETLEVERELSRVREDIERIKGRLTVLDRQTAFSTITVMFMRPAPVEVRRNRPPTPFAWLEALGVEHVLQLDR